MADLADALVDEDEWINGEYSPEENEIPMNLSGEEQLVFDPPSSEWVRKGEV